MTIGEQEIKEYLEYLQYLEYAYYAKYMEVNSKVHYVNKEQEEEEK